MHRALPRVSIVSNSGGAADLPVVATLRRPKSCLPERLNSLAKARNTSSRFCVVKGVVDCVISKLLAKANFVSSASIFF